jgi:hypothetical protein
MHAKLTAWIEQAIHHQQSQHFLPTHRLARFRQTLLPKLIQPELLPQLASQPTVAECPWPPQFQAAQLHLHAVQRVGGDISVVGKQTQAGDRLHPANLALRKSAPRSSEVNGPAALKYSDVKSTPE